MRIDRSSRTRWRRSCAALLALGATCAGVTLARAATEARDFDARAQVVDRAPIAAPRTAQAAALAALRRQLPDLAASTDPATGVTSSLWNRGGYLSAAAKGDPKVLALAFLRAHAAALGLDDADLDGLELTDSVFSSATGATHLYFRQVYAGKPVYNGQIQVHVNRAGRVISVANGAVADIAGATAAARAGTPGTAAAAIAAAARHLGVSLSASGVTARQMWLPVRAGDARLVWSFAVETPDRAHHYDFTVDALDGAVWTRFDWTRDASYRVYPQPVESPNHATPTPPADGRVLVTNPADATASPLGWHADGTTSFTKMQGNNVHAYDDLDKNNAPPSSEPSCGASLVCDFNYPIDFASADPNAYTSGAVANLFYWNNVLHDVHYHYGFDEAAGNFQANNLGNGGSGSDAVNAEAQDGNCTAGSCNNANFSTPPDGSPGRMQMYLWTQTTPRRDGDFDSGIIVHEYGHGVSIRTVGGPSNSSCLSSRQQPGEGLSDFWALAFTARASDTGTTPRPMGTYVLGQATSGAGIRDQVYTTDLLANTHTYEDINGFLPEVHFVGEVWASIHWEMYWALVNAHGFSANLYDGTGDAGNQRALLYTEEGLKNTPCNPTFTQVRDAFIQAAQDNHGGEDVCLLWSAFAKRGLGSDADPGPAGLSVSVTNGFAVPASCSGGGGCTDGDGDGYGNPGSASCPNGSATDCDDASGAVNPGATEIPGNGVDDDCDAATPGGCQQQLAEAGSGVAPERGGQVPADLGFYVVSAAAVIFGIRSRKRPTH